MDKHSRLFRRTQEDLVRIFFESVSFAGAAPRLLDALCKSFKFRAGVSWTVDEEAGLLRCLAVRSVRGSHIDEFERASLGLVLERDTYLPGTVWAQRAPETVKNVTREPRFQRRRAAAAAGLRGALAFPIYAGDRVLGVIELYGGSAPSRSSELFRSTTALGSQIGELVLRAESWLRQTSAASSEAERRDQAEAASRWACFQAEAGRA